VALALGLAALLTAGTVLGALWVLGPRGRSDTDGGAQASRDKDRRPPEGAPPKDKAADKPTDKDRPAERDAAGPRDGTTPGPDPLRQANKGTPKARAAIGPVAASKPAAAFAVPLWKPRTAPPSRADERPLLSRLGLRLVLNASVKEELKLTEEQAAKLEEEDKELRARFTDQLREARLDKEKLDAIYTAMNAEATRLAAAVLTRDQMRRLRQVDVQIGGLSALLRQEIREELGLSEEQKSKIDALNEEYNKRSKALIQEASGDREKLTESVKKARELRDEALEASLRLLSDDQRKAWREMTGAHFDYKPTPFRRSG
jgi:hypothetical protein